MPRRDATSLKSLSLSAKSEDGYQFSPNFVSWCANCENPFHYFEPNSCSFIYANDRQPHLLNSSTQVSQIVGFYCPNCQEALAQAQPIFASTSKEMGEGEEETGLTEEWRYPTDEELEDVLDWAGERV